MGGVGGVGRWGGWGVGGWGVVNLVFPFSQRSQAYGICCPMSDKQLLCIFCFIVFEDGKGGFV